MVPLGSRSKQTGSVAGSDADWSCVDDDISEFEVVADGPRPAPVFQSGPRQPSVRFATQCKSRPKPAPQFHFDPPDSLSIPSRGIPKPLPFLQTSHSSSTAFTGPPGRPSTVQGQTLQAASSTGEQQSKSQFNSALPSSSKRARTDQDVSWTHIPNLLLSFAVLSTVFEEVKNHPQWKHVTGVILDSFAASTLKKYLT